jgi:hypothetical protein
LQVEGVVTIIAAMDEPSADTKREIVKLVFPDLRYGGDPDIERYFELRKDGRLGQALAVYNGALRVRYPDDSSRVVLLKLYRERDPRYASYQDGLVLEFAGRLISRIRKNIDLITAPLERADLSDALRALKAVESVLSRLPGETDGALALLSRYDEFARVMRYKQTLARRALELVREYDAVSRADSPADYDFVARSAALEEKRRGATRPSAGGKTAEEGYDFVSRSAELENARKAAHKEGRSYFDPARIKFSEADRARVEISKELSRREDIVLAFCAKYWPHAADPVFERTVFLYSRKYGGRHFEVFRAIKIGRARRATDDEILSAVSGILTTSYNYSVSGDLYMQVMWRRLRGRMEERAIAERLAVPGPVATTRAADKGPPVSRVRATRQAALDQAALDQARDAETIPPPPAGDTQPTRVSMRSGLKRNFAAPPSFALRDAASRGSADTPPKPRAEPPRQEPQRPELARAASRAAPPPVSRIAAPQPGAVSAPVKKAPSKTPKNKKGATTLDTPSPTLRQAAVAKGARLLVPSRSGPEPVREIRAKRGSISDSIRKLSGRGYDVYKEIFLEKVREHIRKALLANQTRGHGLFDTAANDAEDQVFSFIAAHYDDPFMDWEHSAEREIVESLGFAMPSLDPIVESCFKKL